MDDDRICKICPRGQLISFRCAKHPEKRWNTKNIGYVGARTIFYNLFNDPLMGPECNCPITDMEHVEHNYDKK